MPGTKEADSVKAWRMESLILDLAVGEKSYTDLSEEYGVEEQSLRVFKLRHKPDIIAKQQDLSDSLSHIWATKMENRVRVLVQRVEEIEEQLELLADHARRETEAIRNVDPEASEVLVNGPEWRAYEKEQRALLHEIADQTGGLPARVGKIEMDTKNPLNFGGAIAQDADGNWYSVQQ
jgi:hypothetical protein